MQFCRRKDYPVHPTLSPVFALLGRCFVFVSLHVWTTPLSHTEVPLKIDVVPNAGSFAVAPVAVSTIVNVTKGEVLHKGTVLKKTSLGVFYEPSTGVKVIYDLTAPKNQ